MRLDERETQRRDALSELENEAGGVLAGSDAMALTEQTLAGVDRRVARREADAILDQVGVRRTGPVLTVVTAETRSITLEDKRALLTARLTAGANLVLIAARNFESLPEETVNTLYDQLIELDQLAAVKR